MIDTSSSERVTYNEPPHRFEAGTPPILEAIGLRRAIDWLTRQDRAAIEAHEAALRDRAMEALRGHQRRAAARPGARTKAPSSLFRSRARTHMTWRRSSTARASPCARATIARSL